MLLCFHGIGVRDAMAKACDALLPYCLGPFPLAQIWCTNHTARFDLQLLGLFIQLLATNCDSDREDVQLVVGGVLRSNDPQYHVLRSESEAYIYRTKDGNW